MNDVFEDIEIKCVCGETFMWTSGEQGFLYDLKDSGKIQFVLTPKRCPKCRQKRKEEKALQE